MRFQLQLNPGIVTDETTYSTPGWYAGGNNVRFKDGKPETEGGYEAFLGSTVSGACRNMFAWRNQYNQETLALGTHSALYVWDGSALTDITPTDYITGDIDSAINGYGYGSGGYGMGGYGIGAYSTDARTWAFDNFGETLLACPRTLGLYEWTGDPTVDAVLVAGAPSSMNDMLVTNERQVLALGTDEEISGEYNPLCIRGSDLEDYTTWATTPDNNCFEHILPSGGRIVGGDKLGAYIAVWTDENVFIGEFLGEPDQTYRFDKIADKCGLVAVNAQCVMGDVAYWISPTLEFWAWQLGAKPVLLPCPIGRDFRANIDRNQLAKVVLVANSRFNEIRCYYPDSRDDDENSRHIGFNVGDMSWFTGDFERTAAIDSGVYSYPLACDISGQTYEHEKGTDANGAALSWYIESNVQYMGDGERRYMIRDFWPDIEAQEGNASLTLYVRDYPNGTVRTKGPYTIGTTTRRNHFRAEGRMIAFRLSGNAAGTFARLGQPSFDIVATGKR